MSGRYVACSETEIPRGLTWHTPPRHAGQAIETQYASVGGRHCADRGDPYRRTIDRSVGPAAITYARWVPAAD